MVTKIICRFGSQEVLDEFNERNGFDVTPLTKEYDVHTKEQTTKKSAKKSQKESTAQAREWWKQYWWGMPEYESHDAPPPHATVIFKFNENDIDLARKIFNQSVSEKTKSLWYPKLVQGWYSALRVMGGESKTRYPIYVISKGRAQKCYTSRFLTQMELPHFVVCEPSEYNDYKQHVENKYATLLQLDMSYKDVYDTCDDMDPSFPKGSGPARNFVWDDSIRRGAKWHWIMDDNATEGFHWFWHNIKVKCRSGALLAACEDFVDRYDNIGQFGLNYKMFVMMDSYHPPFTMNTRIYSCILNRNDITDKEGKPFRWRARFNEDTDLSLRILKAGWCTVLANWAMFGKSTTMKVKGGNTTSIYVNGTKEKSEMIARLHPDVAKVVWKFSRWHHDVNYSVFKQQLHLKPGVTPILGIDNYGMKVIDTDEVETYDTKTYLETKYKDTPEYVYGSKTKIELSGGTGPVEDSEETSEVEEPKVEEPITPPPPQPEVKELIIDDYSDIDLRSLATLLVGLKQKVEVRVVHGQYGSNDIVNGIASRIGIECRPLRDGSNNIIESYCGRPKIVSYKPNEKPVFKMIPRMNFE